MCVNGDVAAGSGARAAHARALPLCTRGGGRRKGGLPIPAWPPVHLLLRAQIGAGGAKGWGGGRATPVRPQFVYKRGRERHPPLLRQHLWVKGGGKGRWGHTRKGGARREGGTEGKGIGIVNATLTVLDVASVPQNVLAEDRVLRTHCSKLSRSVVGQHVFTAIHIPSPIQSLLFPIHVPSIEYLGFVFCVSSKGGDNGAHTCSSTTPTSLGLITSTSVLIPFIDAIPKSEPPSSIDIDRDYAGRFPYISEPPSSIDIDRD
ncbi:hypothetical protein EDB84DRAFT_1442959 [Lactarius hengduanensis]|nr:hypothetical protein EDB84DRAFT_1442959 [Lactarius hengduanensis]